MTMGFKLNELELLQKIEQQESARRVKQAFIEGLYRGVERSSLDSDTIKELWEVSKAKAGLEEDDITIPQFGDEDVTDVNLDGL